LTTVAAVAGVGLRDTVQSLANLVVPALSNFSLGRWMVSSVGRQPNVIDKYFDRLSFYTARSRANAVVIGEIGDISTFQFFARDPIIWAEAIGGIMGSMLDNDDITLLEDFANIVEKIKDSKEYSKYGISKNAVIICLNWVKNLTTLYLSDQKLIRTYHMCKQLTPPNLDPIIDRAVLGDIRVLDNKFVAAGLKPYLNSTGEDAELRKEVSDVARVLVLLFHKIVTENNNSQYKSDSDNLKMRVVDYFLSVCHIRSLDYLRKKAQIALFPAFDKVFDRRGVANKHFTSNEYSELYEVSQLYEEAQLLGDLGQN